MTTFPAIEPLRTTLNYGNYPIVSHEALSGANVRFLQGNKRLEQILNIEYEYLTEAQAQTIISHFNNQSGSVIPFDLSGIIWSSWSTPPISNNNYQWRYTRPLEINISSPNRYNISIELVTASL